MKSNNRRMAGVLLIMATAAGWHLKHSWEGVEVTPGKVVILDDDNFFEVRRKAGTLVALYMRPG